MQNEARPATITGMSREIENPEQLPLIPLESIAMPGREQEQVRLIGGILYNKGQNIFLIGENNNGRIQTGRVVTEENNDVKTTFEDNNRLLNLSDFDDITAIQVDLTGVIMASFPSINTHPSVSVSFQVAEATDETQKREVVIDEKSILRIFTGEEGGIAVFSGANLSEENALIFERGNDGKKSALLLFMHPERNTFGADSVLGLGQFVEQLNERFAIESKMSLQDQALAALDKGIQRGDMDFNGSAVREALFRLQIIAYARLAEKTKDPKYLEALDAHLPNLHPPVPKLREIFGFSKPRSSYVETDLFINSIILNSNSSQKRDNNTPESELQTGKTHEFDLLAEDAKIVRDLHSEKARILWAQIAEHEHYNTVNDVSRYFINSLAKMIPEAKTKEDIADIRLLTSAIFSRDFGNKHAGFSKGNSPTYIIYSEETSASSARKLSLTLKPKIEEDIMKMEVVIMGEQIDKF